MSSHLKGPSEGDWSVFAEKVVEERDALREQLETAKAEVDDLDRMLSKQSDILRRTANALHGGPLENGYWSHHDLPELVEQLREALCRYGEHDHGCGARRLGRSCDCGLSAALAGKEDVVSHHCENCGADSYGARRCPACESRKEANGLRGRAERAEVEAGRLRAALVGLLHQVQPSQAAVDFATAALAGKEKP